MLQALIIVMRNNGRKYVYAESAYVPDMAPYLRFVLIGLLRYNS